MTKKITTVKFHLYEQPRDQQKWFCLIIES